MMLNSLKDQLGTKFITSFLLLTVLVFGLIMGVYLVNQKQIFRSKASQNGEVRILTTSADNTVNSNLIELEIILPDWSTQPQSRNTLTISKVYAQEEDQEVEQTFPDESSKPVVLVEVTDRVRISLDPQAVTLDGECVDYLDPNYYCLEISYSEVVEKNNRLEWFLPSLEGEYTIYIGFISNKDNLKQSSVQLSYKKLVPEDSETVSSNIECGCIDGENICNIHCAGYGTTGSQCSGQKDCTVKVFVPSGYNEKTSHVPSVVAIAGQALTTTLIPTLRQLPATSAFNAVYEFFSRPSGGEGYILTINQARTVGLDLEVVDDPLTGGKTIMFNPVQLKEMNVEVKYFPEVDPETGEERIEVIKLSNLARPVGEQSAEVFANTLFGETIGRLVGKGIQTGYNKVLQRKPTLPAIDSYGEIIMPERLPKSSLPKTDPVPTQPNDTIEYPGQIKESLSKLRQSLDEAKEVQIDYRAAVNKLRPTIGGSFDVLPEEKIPDFQKRILQNTGLDTATQYKVKIVRPGDDLFDEKEIEVKLLEKLAESSQENPVVAFEQLVQRHRNLGTFNETIDSRADIFRKVAIAEGMELDGKMPGFTLTIPEDRQIIYYSVNYGDAVDLARAYAEKRGDRVFIASIEQAKNYLENLAEESFYHEVGHISYNNLPQASKNSWREFIERADNVVLRDKIIQIQKDKYGGRIGDIPIDDEAFADFFVNFASGGSRISRLGISSEAAILIRRLINY